MYILTNNSQFLRKKTKLIDYWKKIKTNNLKNPIQFFNNKSLTYHN